MAENGYAWTENGYACAKKWLCMAKNGYAWLRMVTHC